MKLLPLAFAFGLACLPAAFAQDTPAAPEAAPPQAQAEAGEALPTREDVIAYFKTAYAQQCAFALENAESVEPVVHELGYRYTYDDASVPDHPYVLYGFECQGGAYNFSQVYLAVKEYEGIVPLAFAEPSLAIVYADTENSSTVESMAIDGYTAKTLLTNSEFDPASRTITTFSKWRGMGDAYDSATYELVEDRFVLKAFEVDPTFDEEMTPETLLDFRATN